MPGFQEPSRAVVIGASGGIGGAVATELAARIDISEVICLSRSGRMPEGPKLVAGPTIDVTDETSIASAFEQLKSGPPIRLVFVAIGILSDGEGLQPEKSYRHQTLQAFERVFAINTFGPAMVARHALELLPRDGRTMLAMLSARVGSISDNQIGGWHAYRASKAALNMLLKNYAVELGRRNKEFISVGLQPGTVDTELSRPFQSSARQIMTPQESAQRLVSVLASLTPDQSGSVFDHAGEFVPA